jgi:lipid II:glycine glycyltransferase (peptidoglycan interpeptide bridge formation enzyme)
MNGYFLQSKEWENFQKALGRKTFRVQNCLLIKMPLPLGKSYFYSPRVEVKNWQNLTREVNELAQKEGAIFWRAEPVNSEWRIKNKEWRREDFVKTAPVQPAQTLVLDITPEADTILNNMKQKTRYNIRLAQKRGIEVRGDKNQIEKFLKLLKLTTKREKFTVHPDNYYRKMVEVLGDKVDLFLAYFQNQSIAGILTLYYKDTCYYLHGGSDYEHRDLMAPYLLQWQAILRAKEKAAKYYDFWGTAACRRNLKIKTPTFAKATAGRQNLKQESAGDWIIPENHPWAGITRFKMGFGGKVVEYPGAFDLPISKFWYRMYCWSKKLKS